MKKALIQLINFYQTYLSRMFIPILGFGCKFYPTCSEFTKGAILKHGTLKGGKMSIKRILSCNNFL